MISKYTILRYLPDIRSEEFINVGVVVIGDNGETLFEWVDNYERVYRVSDFDASAEDAYLNHVRENIRTALPALTLQKVETYVKNTESIQWTPPRASTLAPRSLLQEVTSTYLHKELL